jgi:hypothetical protein
MTKLEYEQRYVNKDGSNHYPPNGGAVPGTIVDYHDANAFIRDYGHQLDRIGHPGGKYLALMDDGAPATFSQRGLSVDNLAKPYGQYGFTGNLPHGWNIRISEVTPAFGGTGGGLQVQIIRETGEVMSVVDLLVMSVLRLS